ncbi:hypothetical protein, partial [Bilophila wadsworthia]|uniref:hypothetical protein n=2 Tax=Bilophila wadsworthia TaxID=35833 RepID=UPI0027B9255C
GYPHFPFQKIQKKITYFGVLKHLFILFSLPRTPSLPKTFDLIESLISAFTDSKKPSQEQGRLFFFGNPLQRGFDKDESLWGGKGEVWRGEGGPFFRKALPPPAHHFGE